MPDYEYPKADRVPRRQRLFRQTREVTIATDWTPLNSLDPLTQMVVFRGDDFALPTASSDYGDITVHLRNVDTENKLQHFSVQIGLGQQSYEIPNAFGLGADFSGSYHPFFYTTGWPVCGDEKHETIEAAYPPSAIFENALSLPGAEDVVLLVDFKFYGYPAGLPMDYGCQEGAEAQIELKYRVDMSYIDPEPLDDEPLDLWDVNVCSNVVFLPAIPRRDHDELNSAPRVIGFTEDRGIVSYNPGAHSIPENFMELFSAHRTRMVEEEPATTNAVFPRVQSAWTSLTPDDHGVTLLRIEGISTIPSIGNTRGRIIVHVRGVDTSQDPNHFFVRFGAEQNEDSYDIPTDPDHPDFDFYPFFSLAARCAEQEQSLDSAYPPKAISDNVTGPEDGPWDLIVALRWQGFGGFYGSCGNTQPMAQIELVYQVFAGSETATEVCKHSYAAMVIAPDGYGRGFFCSKQDFIFVQRFQENHYALPFVNRGTADFSEPEDGQQSFSVSQQVPPGMCGLIAGYHAPRWTELALYSDRKLCTEIR